MDIIFTPTPVEQLLCYIREKYPYCDVCLIGDAPTLSYALEKGGNRVVFGDGSLLESVRIVVAVGGEKEVELARQLGLPYAVLADGIFLSLLQDFYVYDFQKIENRYPNIAFIKKNEDGRKLRAELEILRLALSVECLNLLGSAIRTDKVKKGKETLSRLAEYEKDFHTDEEWFYFMADCIKGLGGLEYVSFLFGALERWHPENLFYAKYYSLFSLLYLIRLFTKIDFCVILPRVDLCRVRMLAESQGITLPKNHNVQASSFIPVLRAEDLWTEKELVESLGVFRFCVGEGRVDYDALLTSVILSVAVRPKKEMVGYFVDMGYVDALLNPSERGRYESNS